MKKVVSGFVVRQETFVTEPTSQVLVKKRKDVSRVYHSRDAAETMMKLLQKENHDGDYFIHERTSRDDAEIY